MAGSENISAAQLTAVLKAFGKTNRKAGAAKALRWIASNCQDKMVTHYQLIKAAEDIESGTVDLDA